MGKTSGTPANEEIMTHVSDRMLKKDKTSQLHRGDTQTEPYFSKTPATQSEYLEEKEQMESDYGFVKTTPPEMSLPKWFIRNTLRYQKFMP